ncbi:MAG: DeoR/GlpR transcriptional regulator [Bacteroidales bacterium]|nr:DeoR/GlpR transcriptional regulator [Bacteroidales bacterium]
MKKQTSIVDLAGFFNVSTATIRRDLKDLEKNDAVIQTVGGGVLFQTEYTGALTPRSSTRAIEEKIRIAEYCTELIREQDDILIGPGTTTFLAGKIMSGITDRSFRIITNSLELAIETGRSSNIRTVILGGEIWNNHSAGTHRGDGYFAGCHHHHTLILSADGVDRKHGVSIFETRMIGMIHEMINVSDRIILAVDSGKFGQARYNRIIDWDRINLFVTDKDIPEAEVDFLEAQGIEVITV